MTPILDRIRAHGGEVVRRGHRITLRRGALSYAAVDWIKGRHEALMHEVWPDYDAWQERAAIMEYDAGMAREDAERAAYEGFSC